MEALEITYENWRGEIARRRVVPVRMVWGSNEWHPEKQWLLLAVDQDKGEERYFAMRGIKEVH